MILLTATLVVLHSLVLLPVAWERFSRRPTDDAEIALGSFRYRADPGNSSDLATVEFDLHISLLTGGERAGRLLFQRHRFKVQQSVEELLRNAGDHDFLDPQLTELKRRLQETINITLDERVISEVIITGLVVEGTDIAARAPSQVGDGRSRN